MQERESGHTSEREFERKRVYECVNVAHTNALYNQKREREREREKEGERRSEMPSSRESRSISIFIIIIVIIECIFVRRSLGLTRTCQEVSNKGKQNELIYYI
jgi:hypothetical protein